MKRKVSRACSVTAATLSLLLSIGQPALSLAVVGELLLTNVPADTKVSLVGEDRLDRVELRTPAKDSSGQLQFKLSEREWSSGKYILRIWEAVGNPVAELISLADGNNEIDLTTLLGEAPTAGQSMSPSGAAVGGALAGAVLPGVVLGGGGRVERGGAREELGYSTEREDRRGGGRSGAAISVGTAIVGTLLGSLFGGANDSAPAAPASEVGTQAPAPGAPDNNPEFVADQVLATIPLADLATMQAQAQAIAGDHNLNVIAVNPLASINLGLVQYAITDGLTPPAKSAELATDPRVESAQPDFIYQTSAKQEQLFYGAKLIRADNLPGAATGKGIKVAVIDTGIDVARPEIKGKTIENVDMTGRGLSADVHGTMIAGIIAADKNSAIGVAPGSSLLAVKSCQARVAQRIEGICWTSTLTRGIDFANTKGAQVINLSVGGPEDKLMARLVGEAVQRNITVVAAAGNDGAKGKARYPAALENVVAVTAVDIERHLYNQATRGNFIDVAAPGVEIVSIGPGARLPISSGTSFSAAFVSGVIALLLEQRTNAVPQQLQTILEKTSRDLGAPGKDEEFGSGLVDVCQALAGLDAPHPCP